MDDRKKGGKQIKRPIVIIALGAIFGIILGQNFKYNFLFCICIIIHIQYLDSVGYNICESLKKANCRGEQYSSSLRRTAKKCYRYIKYIFNKQIIITFIISATIFNIYTICVNNRYEKFYKKVDQGVNFEAVIISEPTENEYFNSYTIKGKTDYFKNKKFILYVKKETKLECGDKIKIIGEFSKPDDARNYKGFSYKNYLKTQKIYGSINSEKIEIKSKDNTAFIFKLSNSIRNKIIENIKLVLPEDTSGLLMGIMLGDKTYISDEIMLYFQKSSLAHILAVSGAHVSYIILGLNYIVSINKIPKKSGYIFIILILIVFIFITNFSVSVIRACIMTIILILSKLFYRKSDILNTIAISILIIIIFNPHSINSVSLQLSYLGTIGVIYVSPIVEKIFMKNIKKVNRAECKGSTFLSKIWRKNMYYSKERLRIAKDNKNYKCNNSCTNNHITNNGKRL